MKRTEAMTGEDGDLKELDQLLARARDLSPAADEAFLARVLGDALAEQPRPVSVAPVRAPVARRRGFWSGLTDVFGGGALAGLGSATALGLALGYTDPSALTWVTGGLFSPAGAELELAPAAELFLSEG
jgi:hypothetical protein